jgi:hypothetical protein
VGNSGFSTVMKVIPEPGLELRGTPAWADAPRLPYLLNIRSFRLPVVSVSCIAAIRWAAA